MRRLAIVLAALLALSGAVASGARADAFVRPDLRQQVAGTVPLDPRIPPLVPGYLPGELVYFAVLSEPFSLDDQLAVETLGARVLRSYRTIDAVVLASLPDVVSQVAQQPFVSWMAPVELVHALDDPIADQTRGTPADVGAPAQWQHGITGTSVRIAVLDTGLDATHPDLDDEDFRNWSALTSPPKVVDARNFTAGQCLPAATEDGHGHGTHVAGIATGTGEGTPLPGDDGRYAGIAPGAQLAVGKVMTDAGTGLNSDLIAAMEWAAMPFDVDGCAVGADIVNMSLGSESRPGRLNTGDDLDLVSVVLNRLAVRYGTLFVGAVGNSGPYVGSALEAPGSASQVLSVGASPKDYDLNHDDTQAGDTCAGWKHPNQAANDCSAGTGNQPRSLSPFSSRGPSGDLWLRPDLTAPGYDIVSAQSATGTALASNDMNRGTRADPLYATASGTSMAAPAAAGSAALVLDAYRQTHGGDSPSGASGIDGLTAPAYVLLKAALMNSAHSNLYESRWILTIDGDSSVAGCPPLAALETLDVELCDFADLIASSASLGSLTLYEPRNGPLDPNVGPLGEGAGKLDVGAAVDALDHGVVAYTAVSGGGDDAGTGPRDFQGIWQMGPVVAGQEVSQRLVLHAAPGVGPLTVSFIFKPGKPSDTSGKISKRNWKIDLPGPTVVPAGGDVVVDLGATVPTRATPGTYTGDLQLKASGRQSFHVPVFADVSLADQDLTAGKVKGKQAMFTAQRLVYAKDDTTWPSVEGQSGTGSNSDWIVYPLALQAGATQVTLKVYDQFGHDTYDLYLYDRDHDLLASTHPFAAPGVTDVTANDARGPSTQAAPTVLSATGLGDGPYEVAVSRARVGGTSTGTFGAYVLTVDAAH